MLLRRLIGSALRRARLRQGRTLREVAQTARVSMPYLSEVERGRKEVSSEILAAICIALGMHLGDLLDEIRGDLTLLPTRPAPTAPTGGAGTPAAAGTRPAATGPSGAPGRAAAPRQPVVSVSHSHRPGEGRAGRAPRARYGPRVRRYVMHAPTAPARHVHEAPPLAVGLPGQRLARLELAAAPRSMFTLSTGQRASW